MIANKKLVVSICILLLFCFVLPVLKTTKLSDILCLLTIILLLFQVKNV